jgi:hypothetical protein
VPDIGVTVTLLTGGGFCGCPDVEAGLERLQPVKKAEIASIADNN